MAGEMGFLLGVAFIMAGTLYIEWGNCKLIQVFFGPVDILVYKGVIGMML